MSGTTEECPKCGKKVTLMCGSPFYVCDDCATTKVTKGFCYSREGFNGALVVFGSIRIPKTARHDIEAIDDELTYMEDELREYIRVQLRFPPKKEV